MNKDCFHMIIFDLFLSDSAGSRSLCRLVELFVRGGRVAMKRLSKALDRSSNHNAPRLLP